jgi:plasmid stabilization system protein ParE
MTRRLNIFPRAEQDAQKIFDWIAERSPQGANSWFAALEAATQKVLHDSSIYGVGSRK